ncbi:related to HypA-like protein [Phialocephala subalpina]|uniref:Related to HypA-like protein n=1 Tax=Phialocephala subalpina TaxID=576137 RepID=A0A1L7XWT3_9HELO|nr:related to HypA-like protein [Phialocephala subalpina]
MATGRRISLSSSDKGVFHLGGISSESATKASELLQTNHDKYHIYFNEIGLHNHLAHHMLSLFAVGASPHVLQTLFDLNTSYQRKTETPDPQIVADMLDPKRFQTYLANERHYVEFLTFFEQEIDRKGWQSVLNQYVFKGDELADDMLVRMFEGYLHPLIHLGFGIEFNQPAIMAEALAQAAVHANPIKKFLLSSENVARSSTSPSKALIDLINDVYANEKLSGSARWEDREKLIDGVLARASKELIECGSQWKVAESELEKKTAEMINACFVFTFGAQHPPKSGWLSAANKARLLEWKGRMDLAIYASRGCPKVLVDELTTYVPRSGGGAGDGWNEVIARAANYVDSHAIKLIRAMGNAEVVCRPYDDDSTFVIKGADWLKLANMAMDSVEEGGGVEDWIRNAGFDEAWEGFPERQVGSAI